eukprot:TRINITY_DN3168_c0_g1_i2.p1 TRINITY_DN3168_c0_g1~~TRINITY_DN3168_c0_g1_i2.p1  ORF type:complete len:280 (+),score=54.61 TRINITY_DN3168_c0_g1_i2:74-913(+)
MAFSTLVSGAVALVEAENASLALAAACSAADQSAINALPAGDNDGSFPKTTSDCAHAALSIFSGIDEHKFNDCLMGKVKVSTGCSTCYAHAATYGFQNCKLACLKSWCSKSCLNCAKGYDARGCAGFDGPQPTPCDAEDATQEEDVLALQPQNGACSAADQGAINALPAGDADGSFAKTTSDCAKSAYSIFSGLREDKFNQCLQGKVSVSSGCSTCYAHAASYGAKNCKLACLRSWCSQGCLDCAKGYDTNGCAGFAGPQPTPCGGELKALEAPQTLVV